MADQHTCKESQACLRSYLLQTLSEATRSRVECHLRECPVCQAMLEAERERLRLLEALPREEARQGLAERTLAHIENTAERRTFRDRLIPTLTIVAVIGVLAAIALPILTNSREAARSASTQNSMKQLGIVFKMFAQDSAGERWPQLAAVNNAWAPDLSRLYPDLVTDQSILISSAHPDQASLHEALKGALNQPNPDYQAASRLMGESFGYLGYSVQNAAEFEALSQARRRGRLPQDETAGDEDPISADVYPLREGLERFLITDINNPAATAAAQSEIPVLVEIAPWKYKDSIKEFRGANVLFMDGHVEFVPYGTFPVVKPVLDELSGISPKPVSGPA